MKIKIIPDKLIKGGWYRFSVAIEEDDGRPLMSIHGWRLANWQHVLPPSTRGTGGASFAVVEVPDEDFKQSIVKTLLRKIDPDGTKRAEAEE